LAAHDMSELFELRSNPELDSPVMIVALEGWIDAGFGGATALASIIGQVETSTIAEFDADYLLDHRARRPTMRLEDGVNAGLTWPSIELQALTDLNGNDAVLLVGYEPDHAWRAFADAVTNLALELGVRLVTGLGAYPAPVPHTRPTTVVSTATSKDLARQVGSVPGRIDVPAGVLAVIERCCADHGLPAVGLWAQVPHYAAAMPFPAAAAALVRALDRVTGLHFDVTELTREAQATNARLDELVSGSAEHVELVHQLERQVDSLEGEELSRVTGDELAAELEKFLRDQGS
jgi:proteasome assembly chaperone (PAC2) family protein